MLEFPAETMLTRNDSGRERRKRFVSESWLEAILVEFHSRENPGVRVTVKSFDVTDGSEISEPVLSDIISLSVDSIVDEEPESYKFVVKLLPLDPFGRHFVTEAEFDLREIKFYTEVVPDLERFQAGSLIEKDRAVRLPLPKCYLGKYVPFAHSETPPSTPCEINESIIVLEDLKKRGYRNVHFNVGLSLGQAESAFEVISKLHALSLAMKVREKKSLFDKYPFLFQTQKASASYQQLMERGLPQLIRFLENRRGDQMKEVIDCLNEMRPKTKRLVEAFLRPREPICLMTHTDFWSNNLLFRGKECVVLDWQMVTCSQPTNDLALLVISSLPSEIRRKHTTHLLDVYWRNFTRNAANFNLDVENELNYTRENLRVDFESSQLLALLLCIGSIDVALNDSDVERRLFDVLDDLHRDGILSSTFLDSHL